MRRLVVTHRRSESLRSLRLRASRLWLVIVTLAISSGCAGLGKKSPVTAAVADCRRFSCQGVTAMETGDLGQAETLLRQAVEASPTDADTRRHLAETLWARGEQREAVEHIRAAVDLQPDHPEIAVRSGEMLLATGAPIEALGEANRALSLNPKIAKAWALRGRAHVARGEADRGLADLHQSLQLDSADRGVLADLAALHRQANRRQRELTTLHRLRDTYLPGDEPIELMATEAEAYLAIGQPTRAAERLRLACARGGSSAPLLCQLAEAEAAAGDSWRAMTAVQQALTADANHVPSQQLMARLGGSAVR